MAGLGLDKIPELYTIDFFSNDCSYPIKEGDFVCNQSGDCGEVVSVNRPDHCIKFTDTFADKSYTERGPVTGQFVSQTTGGVVEFSEGDVVVVDGFAIRAVAAFQELEQLTQKKPPLDPQNLIIDKPKR